MRSLPRVAGRGLGEMEAAIKLVFDILAFSSIMVLVVLGLAVIASLMGIFNLGHGEFVLLGAYTVFLFIHGACPAGPACWRRPSSSRCSAS